MIKITDLQPKNKTKAKRVGRGNASGSGTYSSRGMKGQRSRSGGRGGLKLMGLKQTFHKIPKIAGFKSKYPKLLVVNIESLEKKYRDGSEIKLKGYKVLAEGTISKKFKICASAFSKKAEAAIIKAGGEATKCGKK